MRVTTLLTRVGIFSLAASLGAQTADKAQLWIGYRPPTNKDLVAQARQLEADASTKYNLELQACSNGRGEAECRRSAEFNYRRRLSAIPGAAFSIYAGESRPRRVLNLSAQEATNPTLNQTLGHVENNGRVHSLGVHTGPVRWTLMGPRCRIATDAENREVEGLDDEETLATLCDLVANATYDSKRLRDLILEDVRQDEVRVLIQRGATDDWLPEFRNALLWRTRRNQNLTALLISAGAAADPELRALRSTSVRNLNLLANTCTLDHDDVQFSFRCPSNWVRSDTADRGAQDQVNYNAPGLPQLSVNVRLLREYSSIAMGRGAARYSGPQDFVRQLSAAYACGDTSRSNVDIDINTVREVDAYGNHWYMFRARVRDMGKTTRCFIPERLGNLLSPDRIERRYALLDSIGDPFSRDSLPTLMQMGVPDPLASYDGTVHDFAVSEDAAEHCLIIVVVSFPNEFAEQLWNIDGRRSRWSTPPALAVARTIRRQTGSMSGLNSSSAATKNDAGISNGGRQPHSGAATNQAAVLPALEFSRLTPPFGHRAGLSSASFSPDSKFVLTSSDDSTVQVWNAASGTKVKPPLTHRNGVRGAAFSPNGRLIVTVASHDSTPQIWDAITGAKVAIRFPHDDAVELAFFHPDGSQLITASGETIYIWDATSGEKRRTIRSDLSINSLRFSRDGARFVVSNSSDSSAQVWDFARGQPIGAPLRHKAPVNMASLSPDGDRAITASDDHTAQVWKVATGARIAPALSHQYGVEDASFSSDGLRVVTASRDNTAQVWNAVTGERLGPPLRLDSDVRVVAFSPDGRSILTASGVAQVWGTETRVARVGIPMRHAGKVRAATFSPDGQRIVTVCEDSIAQAWDATTGEKIGPPIRHPQIFSAHLSFDGHRVVTASYSAAQVWEVTTGSKVGLPLQHSKMITSAAISHDGRRILTASYDSTAQLWDALTGQKIGRPLRHSGAVHSAEFSPDGHRIVTSADSTAQVWDAATGEKIGLTLRHDEPLIGARFGPDGRRVVTASSKTLALWNGATGARIEPVLRQDERYTNFLWGSGGASLSPDGERIVVVSDGHYSAEVWDHRTAARIWPPLEHGFHLLPNGLTLRAFVRYADLSADGRRVVTAADDSTAQVWDVSALIILPQAALASAPSLPTSGNTATVNGAPSQRAGLAPLPASKLPMSVTSSPKPDGNSKSVGDAKLTGRRAPAAGTKLDTGIVGTPGVDFPYPSYTANVARAVLLEFGQRRVSYNAVVRFVIRRDGSVEPTSIDAIGPSAPYVFLQMARGAIEAAANHRLFGPLPAGFSADTLSVLFWFSPRLSK